VGRIPIAIGLAQKAVLSLRQQGTFHFYLSFFAQPGEKGQIK
jgi:hypothetical protein